MQDNLDRKQSQHFTTVKKNLIFNLHFLNDNLNHCVLEVSGGVSRAVMEYQ